MLFVSVFTVSLFLPPLSGNETTGLVLVTDLNGVVGISMENYVSKVLETGKEKNVALIVFELDTPGGLVSSMRAITNAIMDSPVPVLVWVSPRGARAASAGAFIVQSASIAAMSPGTNIGAAHPVQASGGDVPDEEMNKKI
ncbi:MAG: ATP-dependent Clp protease proteolytic subunit, partial [Synergistales bacterium]|nr:ATP-dependent Clp protease proteolytic subunit [Synergistales bacterium]